MKINNILLLFFLLTISMIACVSQQKIQYYNFPDDIAEDAKTANLKMIEKGRILYSVNCAKCHNTKEKRRILIPDFTNDQLDSYIIRVKNEAHVNNLSETKVTVEELEAIQFFFSYKKPSRPVSEK